jgi:hypothetical protein
MIKGTCSACVFYGSMNQCRRYPPRVEVAQVHAEGYRSWDRITVFPDVTPNDWCGEYEEKRK